MIKPKVIKIIMDELGISNGKPFNIEGEKTPYRMKKDGGIERFMGQVWIDSSYSYTDIILFGDSNRITLYEGVIMEAGVNSEAPKIRRSRKEVKKK